MITYIFSCPIYTLGILRIFRTLIFEYKFTNNMIMIYVRYLTYTNELRGFRTIICTFEQLMINHRVSYSNFSSNYNTFLQTEYTRMQNIKSQFL